MLMQILSRSPFFAGILVGALVSAVTPLQFMPAASAEPCIQPCYASPLDYFQQTKEISDFIGSLVGESGENFAPALLIESGGSVGAFSLLRVNGAAVEPEFGGAFVVNQEVPLESLTKRLGHEADRLGLADDPSAKSQASWLSLSLYSGESSANLLATSITLPDGQRVLVPINPLRTFPSSQPALFPSVVGVLQVIVLFANEAGYGAGNLLPSPNCPGQLPVVGGDPNCGNNAVNNYARCLCFASHTYNASLVNCSIAAALAALTCITAGWTVIGTAGCVASLASVVLCYANADLAYRKAVEGCENKLAEDRSMCILQQ